MTTTKSNKKKIPGRKVQRYTQLQDLSMNYEGQNENIPLHPPDISPHGMFVNTPAHFPEGAVVNLRFRLTRSNVQVHTRGEVRYCIDGIGIGVEFVGIEPEVACAIEKEVCISSRTRRSKN